MASFGPAIAYVLQDEGGYSPANAATGDPETNFGIIDTTARAYGWTGPMSALSLQTAKDIYQQEYWTGLDAVTDQRVATAILTYRVNMGVAGGTIVLQQALNQIGQDISIDGGFGPETLAAVNDSDPAVLLQAIVYAAKDRYHAIVDANPEKEPYLNGWLARADRILSIPAVQVAGAGLGLAIMGLVVFLGGRR